MREGGQGHALPPLLLLLLGTGLLQTAGEPLGRVPASNTLLCPFPQTWASEQPVLRATPDSAQPRTPGGPPGKRTCLTQGSSWQLPDATHPLCDHSLGIEAPGRCQGHNGRPHPSPHSFHGFVTGLPTLPRPENSALGKV